ncbi:hypothetical protein CN553_20975, partial [Bacillus cereus]
AGDISHAAGNELSQMQIDTWKEDREYVKGEKVEYNGTIYELLAPKLAAKVHPDEHGAWNIIGGKVPEWKADRQYYKGSRVFYNGTVYQTKSLTPAAEKPDESFKWVAERVAEWNANKSYPKDTIIRHEGKYYKALSFGYGDLPTDSLWSKWKLVNKDGSDVEKSVAQAKEKPVVPNKIENKVWNFYTLYRTGDIVNHKEKKYEMICEISEMGHEPDKSSWIWKEVNGKQSEGNLKKEDGNNVIIKGWKGYEGDRYKMNDSSEFEGGCTTAYPEILDWIADRDYRTGDIVSYKGAQYKMISNVLSRGDRPGKNPSKWEVLYGGLNME